MAAINNNGSSESGHGKLYIAYGSNLNLTQMHNRCPTAEVAGKSELKNHRLCFVGDDEYAVANVIRVKGETVPVLIWRIQPSDEQALDRYEGYPRLYRKEYRFVNLSGKRVKAMIYIMNQARRLGIPNSIYLETIREGYIAADFDSYIFEEAARRSYSHTKIPNNTDNAGGKRMNARIKEQILAIRDSGETNMLDTKAVQYIANRENFFELVIFIEDHRKEYVNFIFYGDDEEK